MFSILNQWIDQNQMLLTGIGISSLILSVASLILLPWLVAQIPYDYFAHDRREPSKWKELHPIFRFAVLVVKNILGFTLLLAGIAMLLLPGQGLLSILMGLVLMDYPGKFRFERKIVSRPKLLQFINWLRRKQKQPPLTLEIRDKQ
ncbi:MAG: PGPGW domain-containing protein [Campylobacterota bacterium]